MNDRCWRIAYKALGDNGFVHHTMTVPSYITEEETAIEYFQQYLENEMEEGAFWSIVSVSYY